MDRRTLFKTALAALAALGTSNRRNLHARVPAPGTGVRLVVFGIDGLRIDSAQQLRAEGSPGLSALSPPKCVLSGGGLSMTQPEWASIWSALPCAHHGSYQNDVYNAMPMGAHIMGKVMEMYKEDDLFPVWITGKGENIRGNVPKSPHYQVFEPLVLMGKPGAYHGDRGRENSQVFSLANTALSEAVLHENFCCFIHFKDPDYTGHNYQNYTDYLNAAREVDEYVYQLMQRIPPGTEVIYCSDHGFNFTELGEVETHHYYAPKGMLATNFDTASTTCISRQSVGRLIYRRAGGDPDHCPTAVKAYSMYGVDL